MRVGTAGWSIPRDAADSFPGEGQHLQRYARILGCAEINTSFYRSHQVGTYERWAAMTPPGFRFSVKMPRTITHDARLRGIQPLLDGFLAETAGLGDRLGVLLVQLPPSLAFETRPIKAFFRRLRDAFDGAVACEPRHATWFTPAAERALVEARISRVAVDPAPHPDAARPGGWLGPAGDGREALRYYRWHGSPRVYWSRYTGDWLAQRALELAAWPDDAEAWCIFDNTAAGAAIVNALEFQSGGIPATSPQGEPEAVAEPGSRRRTAKPAARKT